MKKIIYSNVHGISIVTLFTILLLMSCNKTSKTRSDHDSYFNIGESNDGKTGDKPYLNAGNQAYIVGLQDGSFPDIGGHVAGEMGGIWAHPIKLLDGFWLMLADIENNNEEFLVKAKDFHTFPHGLKFTYAPILNGIKVDRFQYVPEGKRGIIVEYTLKNVSEKKRNIAINFYAKTDLMPVWFSQENNIDDTDDILKWNEENKVFNARDSINNWFATWGTSNHTTSFSLPKSLPFKTKGRGKMGTINTVVEFDPHQEIKIKYIIAGSTNNQEDANTVYKELISKSDSLLQNKKDRYKDVLETSKITIPDKKLEKAYNWIKINTKWLEMDLPNYGRFLSAGAIEYPWLFGCDNSYALQGLVASGDFELAKSTLRILKNVSERENGDGRIIHEMSTNGFVANKGNTQETAHFIVATWQVFQWTGDYEFLKEIYPYAQKGIDWLLIQQDKNRNLFPEGYGIAEVKGLNAELIDVAVYTQQALEAMEKIAIIFKDNNLSSEYGIKARLLKEKINSDFWDEKEGIYGDFYGTREQAIRVANGAIEQVTLDSSKKDKGELINTYKELISKFSQYPIGTKKGWFTNKYWTISIPMEMGITPKNNAIRSLDKIRKEHTGTYGPYLSATERHHMMTISTAVQAVSEAKYGRVDESLWYMDKIASSLGKSFPGSINEMMPDYGCPVQAWTIYGVATPLISYIFGIQPNAYYKNVKINPKIPNSWNYLSLNNQKIGDNTFNFDIIRDGNTITYTISSQKDDWSVNLGLDDLNPQNIEVNGKTVKSDNNQVILNGVKNTIKVRLFKSKN